MPSYRFARRPAWIASHVFVLVCVVVFVRLGFWQLARLGERQEQNAVTEARLVADPVPLDTLVAVTDPPASAADDVFRRVTATGTYRTDEQVLVRNRTNDELPGYWVLTPLRDGRGAAVLVNRGWVPLQVGEGDAASFAPPPGPVTVTGMVRASQAREGIGPEDPPDGRLAVVSRVDIPRLAVQLGEPVAPVYVDLIAQDPAQSGNLPRPVPPPEVTNGSHLSYAVQWFTFATLTVVVYVLILRRRARRAPEEREGVEDLDAGDEPLVLGPRR